MLLNMRRWRKEKKKIMLMKERKNIVMRLEMKGLKNWKKKKTKTMKMATKRKHKETIMMKKRMQMKEKKMKMKEGTRTKIMKLNTNKRKKVKRKRVKKRNRQEVQDGENLDEKLPGMRLRKSPTTLRCRVMTTRITRQPDMPRTNGDEAALPRRPLLQQQRPETENWPRQARRNRPRKKKN
uniref:Uncharacterized protein n=1 Tax=Cacopsylla melanoneura TaxID=428564 RepID=A0A8D8U986_9HEMI